MSRRKPEDKAPTETIGWQGYTLAIPQGWTIGAIGGDNAEGYLRIDGTDMARCEIKWFGERPHVDIASVVEKYLKDMQKKRKRRAPEITVKRDTRLLGRKRGGRLQLEAFHWESEAQQAHGAAWVCKQCGRTTIIQVLGSPDEKLEDLATRTILSLTDHPNEGWCTWATYGLMCEVPEEFKLSGQKLMAGLLEFNFALDTEKVTVMRWGMADVALADGDLLSWSQKELAKRVKGWDCGYEEIEYNGHPAIAVTGGPAQFGVQVRRFAAHCLRKTYGSNIMSLIWHCEPEKKIYCVECILDDANLELPAEICRRIPCHQE